MSKQFVVIVFVALLNVVLSSPIVNLEDLEWFWVDYNGSIPDNAYPGGIKNGLVTYIGQKYIHNLGLQITDVIQNPDDSQFPEENPVKVLCSFSSSRLTWLDTDIDNLKNDLDGKVIVSGGVSYYGDLDRVSPIAIGLTKIDDSTVLLGPLFYNSPTPLLYYTDSEGNTKQTGTYSVLIWN